MIIPTFYPLPPSKTRLPRKEYCDKCGREIYQANDLQHGWVHANFANFTQADIDHVLSLGCCDKAVPSNFCNSMETEK